INPMALTSAACCKRTAQGHAWPERTDVRRPGRSRTECVIRTRRSAPDAVLAYDAGSRATDLPMPRPVLALLSLALVPALSLAQAGPDIDAAVQAVQPKVVAWRRDLHQHPRSEEHTSELQSRENLVCRLLLEKKNGCRPRD